MCNSATALGTQAGLSSSGKEVPKEGICLGSLVKAACGGGAASWRGLEESRMQGRPEPGKHRRQQEVAVRKLCGWHVEAMKLSWHLPTSLLSARGLLAGVPASGGHLCQVLRSGRGMPGLRQGLGDGSGTTGRLCSPRESLSVSLSGSSCVSRPSPRG